MTTYIAGPMTGIPDFNYPMFNMVAKTLRDKGLDVRNPAENDDGSAGKPWEFYMRLALCSLLECDAVVLLPGWRNSRGARIEEWIARELGMQIEDWVQPPVIAHATSVGEDEYPIGKVMG